MDTGMRRGIALLLMYMLSLYIMSVTLECCCAADTLTRSQGLSMGQTLISASQIFELGFFRPGNSSKTYLGIWYLDTSVENVVWVANSEDPLTVTDTATSLIIGSDGNLEIQDGKQNIVWSTNVSLHTNSTYAVLSDDGDFRLYDSLSRSILWASFDSLGDTLLPRMMLGTKTDESDKQKQVLSSWRRDDDPSPGKFILGLSSDKPPQAFIWKDLKPYWRSGPWDGGRFIGVSDLGRGYSTGIAVIPNNQQGSPYLTISEFSISFFLVVAIKPEGYVVVKNRNRGVKEWTTLWKAPNNPCEYYGACGSFAICRKNRFPICECLKGFVPKSNEEWSKGNWTKGCVRRTELSCGKNASSLALGRTKIDGFLKLSKVNLPDLFEYLFNEVDATDCRRWCLNNCSCTGYAYVAGIGCMVWAGDQTDIQQYSVSGEDFFLRLAHSELGSTETKGKILIVGLTTILGLLLIGAIIYASFRWRAYQRGMTGVKINLLEDVLKGEQSELPMFDFDTIVAATNSFSYKNKLGEGGFGPVYEGVLDNGQQIAVKRLSIHSGQGSKEFKNEIQMISGLQHRNLVKLLGCCIQGEEKLLIYEFMTNKSLDTFLFDPKKQSQLDWTKRFNIILGIARGILYLHRDSCLRVIHRDLKTSNILLDDQMNPKISDFGLARAFQITEELSNTHRIVGTFGYMSPEYAIGGIFSEKSDVFGFGVMLLEIVSGKRNSSFFHHEQINLLGYAWELWNSGKGEDLIDQAMGESCPTLQVLRCIHVGLLCVQDFAEDRPTMSTVVQIVSNDSDLPRPKQPIFTSQRALDLEIGSECNKICSNNLTTSMIEGR